MQITAIGNSPLDSLALSHYRASKVKASMGSSSHAVLIGENRKFIQNSRHMKTQIHKYTATTVGNEMRETHESNNVQKGQMKRKQKNIPNIIHLLGFLRGSSRIEPLLEAKLLPRPVMGSSNNIHQNEDSACQLKKQVVNWKAYSRGSGNHWPIAAYQCRG